MIHGNIFDSRGARVSHGRVLVLAEKRDSVPIEVLELEGTEREYRCELPSKQDYYLVVDPSSLGEGLIPSLVRSRKKSRRDQASLDDLSNFTKIYVSLSEGEVVRQDLMVGRLAMAMGRLLAMDGTPIPGALARLTAVEGHIAGFSADALTGADGNFRIDEVFPGDYQLTFSRRETWNPPMPLEIQILGGEARDFGDIFAGGGQRSIRGMVVMQGGKPFEGLPILAFRGPKEAGAPSPFKMNAVLARAKTDASGHFDLQGLPETQVLVSLTPGFEPNVVGGAGHPAMWVPNVFVDLEDSLSVVDIGTHTVEESRPFRITGELQFDEAWLAAAGLRKQDLVAIITEDGEYPPTKRPHRVPLHEERIAIDFDSGPGTNTDVFELTIETPRPEVELRFELSGLEPFVLTLHPEPLGSWSREIRVPGDFPPP